eukprot:3552467-Prymnesium_polylepis.1
MLILQAAAHGTTPAAHLPLRPGRHRQVHTDTAAHCVLAFARAARAAHRVEWQGGAPQVIGGLT